LGSTTILKRFDDGLTNLPTFASTSIFISEITTVQASSDPADEVGPVVHAVPLVDVAPASGHAVPMNALGEAGPAISQVGPLAPVLRPPAASVDFVSQAGFI